MKKKFAVQNSKQTAVVELANVEGMTDQQILDLVNQGQPAKNKYTSITNLKGKHICQYCGEVTTGTDEDRLCDDCRETFGHAFYSEL